MSPTWASASPAGEFRQILPPQFSAELYAKDALSTHRRLRGLARWPNGLERIGCPYPLTTPACRAQELARLHSALHTALVALVRRWWSRPDFASVIPVTAKVERVLRRLDEVRPYTAVGSFRPDFLVPEDGGIALKICEINARFVFNGYFLGALQTEAMVGLGLNMGYEKAGEGIVNIAIPFVQSECNFRTS